jgi:hypothetical protein
MTDTTVGVHITTNPLGTGWVTQKNGAVVSEHKEKQTAIKSGRLVAKRHGMQFTVHRTNGTVIETRSYAPSPV